LTSNSFTKLMKQVTLNIPENKLSFFMTLIESLNFVELAESPNVEANLNSDQKGTWENVKTGFEELKMVKEGKSKARPIESLFEELGI
jgi:hypothetical protein